MSQSTTPSPDNLRQRGEKLLVDDSEWSSKRPEKGLREAAAKGGRRGRPQQCPRAVVVRVVDAHLAGRSMRAIAEQLNNKGVPTPGHGSGKVV